ncbi:hypothetical protein B0H19DRAFT_1177714 [Mycena capillaripes]|nr:hypothetical protein B0H19DRAFT_1177714 [Mycena capillaripes]
MGLLGGVVTALLGGSEATPDVGSGAGAGIPGLPSLPGLPTLSIPLSLPPIFPPTGIPSSASAPPSSSASAASSSAPLSSSSSPASSESPSSPPPTSTPTPTPTPPPAAPSNPSLALPDVTTDSAGGRHTVSNTVFVTGSTASQSSTPAHNTSFLENKPLSGAVFGLAGLVGLVLIVFLVSFFLRRRRRNRLLDDAVSFDPTLLAAADRYDGSEKGHSSNASLGTTGSGRPMPGYGTTYNAEPAQYAYGGGSQQPYYGAPQPAQHQEYYGAPQQMQQPYYSTYVPPMADAPPHTLAGTTPATHKRAQHSIPRVPVPAQPLPQEFGSSEQDRRTSVEESEFWAKTLKVSALEQSDVRAGSDAYPGH